MTIQLTITATDNVDLKRQLSALLGAPDGVIVEWRDPVEKLAPAKETVTKSPPASAPPAEKPAETQGSKRSQKPSDTSTAAPTVDQDGGATSASPSDDSPFDYNADIKPAVLKVSQKHGRDGVLKLLTSFGVGNASEISPDRYPELMAEINKLLED